MNSQVKPIEETMPEVAEFFRQIANDEHEIFKSVQITENKVWCKTRNKIKVNPNKPCICGSGKKFKKCCAKVMR